MQRCPKCRTLCDDPTALRCPRDGAALLSVVDALAADAGALVGRLIGPHYLIEAALGTGSTGFVVRARNLTIDRPVAIKLLRPEVLAGHPGGSERFVAEARMACRARHPGIVDVLDLGVSESGIPYLVMEFLDGRSLRQALAVDGPLDLDDVLEVGAQLCEALAAVHAEGLVHRDLKPDNCWLATAGGGIRVKLLDFSVAGDVGDAPAVVGTPGYMAPEQIRGERFDARADLYALGCLLTELATGELPFQASGRDELLARQLLQPPRRPSALRPGLPRWFDSLVVECLATDPDDRPQDVQTVARRLAIGRAAPSSPLAPAPLREGPSAESIGFWSGDRGDAEDTVAAGSVAAAAGRPADRRRRVAWVVAGLAAAGLLAWAAAPHAPSAAPARAYPAVGVVAPDAALPAADRPERSGVEEPVREPPTARPFATDTLATSPNAQATPLAQRATPAPRAARATDDARLRPATPAPNAPAPPARTAADRVEEILPVW